MPIGKFKYTREGGRREDRLTLSFSRLLDAGDAANVVVRARRVGAAERDANDAKAMQVKFTVYHFRKNTCPLLARSVF